jgi:hypothetical protein
MKDNFREYTTHSRSIIDIFDSLNYFHHQSQLDNRWLLRVEKVTLAAISEMKSPTDDFQV